jgi:hypothetical protein
MAIQSLAAQVGAWTKRTKARQLAVFQGATHRMFVDVLARTPRDTGFLANTLEASLSGPQTIRTDARPPSDAAPNSYPAPIDFGLAIATATIGDTVYGSFGAAYAGHVEYGTKLQNPAAMVRLSAQNWPHHVAGAVRDARAAAQGRSPQ